MVCYGISGVVNCNGSFANELKEKLLARYTVVFFPIQNNIFVL